MTSGDENSQDHVDSNFADLLESIEQDVNELHMHWKLYRELFAHSDERIDLLNDVAPALWASLQRIMQDSIYLAITRLTDRANTCGKDNLSISVLIREAKKEGFDSLATRLSDRQLDLESLTKDVRWHRHKRLAHNDADTAKKNKYTRPSRLAIEAILNEVRNLLNDIREALGMPHCAYEHVQYSGGGESVAYWLAQGLWMDSLRRDLCCGKITSDQLIHKLIHEHSTVQC